VAVVHCASDGAFRVERLPSAEYRVTARLPLVGATDTFVPARIEPSTLVLGSGEARALDVRVDAGESGPLEFTIAVERASESAGVVESIGLGLYAREGDAWIAWNRVDAGSRLELPGLPAGVWDVRARLGIRLASGALRSVAATGSPRRHHRRRGGGGATLRAEVGRSRRPPLTPPADRGPGPRPGPRPGWWPGWWPSTAGPSMGASQPRVLATV
jgi:hypothetical protein